ncbi:hemopexin [Heptranchias perlo]|uniref:hemopexin n=1 Tax=Heptranchias perlo TaxID=212740 RepID=UPI0035599663
MKLLLGVLCLSSALGLSVSYPWMKGHPNITYDEMTKDHQHPIIAGFPNRCDGLGFDAITLDELGVTYFFRDEFVWKGFRGPAELINKTWPSLPGQIDAAFRMHHKNSLEQHDRMFFFKGNEVWQYYGTVPEGKFLIHDKFPGIPDNLGAATECPVGECGMDSVFFFKDDTVYMLDLITNTVKEKTWSGIQHCTAALRWMDRYYCFQGTNFTRFNPVSGEVPDGYPKDARDYFMRCEGRGHWSKNRTSADSIYNRCSKRPFDEFNEDELGRSYAFREGWYFRLDTRRDGWHAWPVNSTWPSLHGKIDGVFSWNNKMYFIQGSQLFIYKTGALYTLIKGYPKAVSTELGIHSTDVDATFICPGSSLLYVIMGNQLQSVNLEKAPKVLGSGFRISHTHVDGAMCNASGVYLFVGTVFYKYDSPDQLATWLNKPVPQNIAQHFMSCPH